MTLRLNGSTSGYTEIDAPAVAGSNTLVLPTGAGSAYQVVRNGATAGSLEFTDKIVSGTAQNSTSGTSIDFTGIPSWVKRVTVMFGGTSSNGSSNWQVRLGTSAGVVSTGYLGSSSYSGGVNATAGLNSTTGLLFIIGGSAQIIHGSVTFNLLNSSTNYWIGQGVLGDSSQAYTFSAAASVTLPGTLDRVRITTVNGTDTFDAGSINILTE